MERRISKSQSLRRWTNVLLTAVLVSGALGAASFSRAFDTAAFIASVRNFNLGWAAAALIVSTVQVFWQLLRFWVAFQPGDRPPTFPLFRVTVVGQLLNYVAPLRSGDAYKVVRLTLLGSSTVAILAALVTERAADVLALFGFSAPGVAPSLLRAGGAALAGVLLVFGLAFWAGRFGPLRRLGSRLRSSLGSRRFMACAAVAAISWTFDFGTLMCSARAGGVHLAPAQAVACVFALNLGIAVPLTVANMGVFEATLGFALRASVVGIGLELAIGIATLEHVVKIGGLLGCLGILLLAGALGPRRWKQAAFSEEQACNVSSNLSNSALA